MTSPLDARAADIAAYEGFNVAIGRLLDAVRERLQAEQDEVRAAGIASVVVAMSSMERQQLAGLLGVLLAQVARGQRPHPHYAEEPGMRLPFTRRAEPAPVPEGPSEAEVLRGRVNAADQAVTRLLACLRLSHRPTAGVDLRECLDAALDVRNALRPTEQPAPAETTAAVTE